MTVGRPPDLLLLLALVLGASATISKDYEELAACPQGYGCMEASVCVLARDQDTLFPCGSEKYCCPVHTVESTTPKLTSKFDNPAWSKVPKELRSKIDLLPEDCGSASLKNRISGGENAGIGEFPWMALVGGNVNGKLLLWCGGTVINNRYVLTAAHCTHHSQVPIKPTTVRLGEWSISQEQDCSGEGSDKVCSDPVLDLEVENIIVHPMFGSPRLPGLRNDISLIRVKKSFKFSDYIQPICLPPSKEKPMTRYIISGWGHTNAEGAQQSDILQYTYVNLFDRRECSSLAPASVRPLDESQFCANGDNEGEEACKGDSGGPLIYDEVDGKVYQKGIVSSATWGKCGESLGKPAIYTELSHFIIWILQNIQP